MGLKPGYQSSLSRLLAALARTRPQPSPDQLNHITGTRASAETPLDRFRREQSGIQPSLGMMPPPGPAAAQRVMAMFGRAAPIVEGAAPALPASLGPLATAGPMTGAMQTLSPYDLARMRGLLNLLGK